MPELPPHVPINRQRTPCADKNDKLGWKDGFCLSCEGLALGIRSNRPEMLPQLRDLCPSHATSAEGKEVDFLFSFMLGGATQRKGVTNYHIVYDAWNRTARTVDLEEALKAFEATIVGNLARHSKERLYLQASVVECDNKGVLLVAPEDQRKELIEALVAGGGSVFCDEYAMLNAGEEFNSCAPGNKVLRPGMVVFAQRKDIKRPRHTELSPGLAAMELFRRSPAAHFQPQTALARLATLSQRAPSYRSVLSSSADLVRLVERRLPK